MKEIKFKINILYKSLMLLIVIVYLGSFAYIHYRYTIGTMPNYFWRFPLLVILSIVLIYILISFIKFHIIISDNKIIVNRFLKKKKSYDTKDLVGVHYVVSFGPIAVTELYFTANRNIIVYYLENQKTFLNIVQSIKTNNFKDVWDKEE